MDIAACRAFVDATAGASDEERSVDESTWQDLDLDAVFAGIDRTLTGPGRMTLYRLLRRPAAPAVLAERLRALQGLEADPTAGEKLGRALTTLSRWGDAHELAALLWDEPLERESLWHYRLLGLAFTTSVAAAYWLGGLGLLCLMVAALVNTYAHYGFRVTSTDAVIALRQLGSLLGVAARTGQLDVACLQRSIGELTERAASSRDMPRQIARLPTGGWVDLLLEYVRIAFMSEPRRVLALLDRVDQHRGSLREVFERIGELDALRSIALWRSELPLRCDPEVSDEFRGFEAMDAVHPLLKRPVANSIHLDGRGVCVTGSNMSGKSTFLRTIGVNAVLAQTVCTATAKRVRLCPLRVLSSMRLGDDLASATSLYMAEAQRLLALVRAVDAGGRTLCLCDELLAGTDAQDRSATSAAILGYLGRQGGLVVVATHDREMVKHCFSDWDSYYFSEELDPTGLVFDFRLQPGIARSRNALRILEHLGYPPEILAEARARGASAT